MTTAVSSDGTLIGYESLGAGPPLLLVHGATATRARWSALRAPLAQHYTVHTMDRRGRGLSSAEAGPYSLRREAEDVAAVAEAVGGNVYVVGHSYGALAVLESAVITTAFRRILLYEPALSTPDLSVVSPHVWERIQTMSDPREILDTVYREALHLSESAIEDLGDREFPHVAGSIAHTAVRELAEVSAYRGIERLANITAPVRILLGTESPAHFYAGAAAVAARIRGATIVSMGGQGHQGIDYDPHQFVRKVVDFDARQRLEGALPRRVHRDHVRC